MMKKQYFCILALCAFVGINVTNNSHAGEIQDTQERGRDEGPRLSCKEKADRVRAQVLRQCQEHRAAKFNRASGYSNRSRRNSNDRAQLSCLELADKVSAKVFNRCQANAQDQKDGTYRKDAKRKHGYGQGYGREWGRSGHPHKQPGHQLYKQEQSMAPTAPSRRQMPSSTQQEPTERPYTAESTNPASIEYTPEQSEAVRMPRGYGQPMQQQEMLAEPSAPVMPEPGLSNKETRLLMAPE